ncbi:MAG: EAL domain-containing protein, partial [Nitrospirota bacterium]|nr:EAL domain-containing protein [Nitrospirota bacterium]
EKENYFKQSQHGQQIVMSRIGFLKNILLISFIAIIIIPLYTIFFTSPAFIKLLMDDTEKKAAQIATHLASMIIKEPVDLKKTSLPVDLSVNIRKLQEEFNLMKLRIFSTTGEIIYSTDPLDIGKINRESYFHDVVIKGDRYTKVVQKSRRTRENRLVSVDVIETYVPVIRGGRVVGAFEIYYDITDEKKALQALVYRSSVILFSIAFVLLVAVIISASRANRIVSERDRAEEELKKYRNELERMVEERTAELRAANEQLQQEVMERQRAEEQIHHLAYYDSLTGLPNRIFYKELLTRSLTYAQRYEQILAILFIDLDNFKRINDSLGHNLGDQLLQAFAAKLEKTVRNSDYVARSEKNEITDTVSRPGGDEFMLLLNEISQVQDAASIAGRLLDDLTKPFVLEGHEVIVTASMGISVYPFDGEDAESLLKNAEIAVHHAKDQGKNNYQFYTESMNADVLERLTLENELHKALDRKELFLHFQPKIDTRTGKIAGVEALIRWNHPGRGLISPDQFIPLAEESGLIVPIGEWVLQTACLQCRAWYDAGFRQISVAVNLSGRQFEQPDLAETAVMALRDVGLATKYLVLEITESMIMQDPERAIVTLQEAKSMGIHVSIDDFGTGYSSLGYLRRFPLDSLKIDRSFVVNSAHNLNDAAIIKAIIALAHSLKLKVVAEGVETEEQEEFLRELDCDEMQGYLFSRPVTGEEIMELLDKEK